jgi:hypothetical protein
MDISPVSQAMGLSGDREHRNLGAVTVEEAVDEVQVARAGSLLRQVS